MRKSAVFFLAFLLIFTLIGCQRISSEEVTPSAPKISPAVTPSPTASPDAGRIGISMPSKSFGTWRQEGSDMKEQLEAKGYTVDLMYANDYDPGKQQNQIEEMITQGCRVLLIGAVDAGSMDAVLTKAKAAGVTVIAYDILIYQTTNLDYFVTFDYAGFGGLQGEYIVNTLGLKDGKGPFNIELFFGDPGDGNMMGPRNAAMDILQPYIDSGQLVVKSGQTDFDEIATVSYSSENAKARMDKILDEYYTHDQVDAVLAISDDISIGIIESFEDAGYTQFPIITGCDGTEASLAAIKAGKQSMSVYEDRSILVSEAVEIADAVMTGREVPVNGYMQNVAKVIPTFLCKAVIVKAENIKEVLSTVKD